jgi:hypothetical protein
MLSYELRDMVLQFIDSKITIKQLEEWLVPRLPVFLKFPDSSDANVVAAIELGLAEISDEIRTEDELRKLFQDAIQRPTVLAFYPVNQSVHLTSESSNQTSLLLSEHPIGFAMNVVVQ